MAITLIKGGLVADGDGGALRRRQTVILRV